MSALVSGMTMGLRSWSATKRARSARLLGWRAAGGGGVAVFSMRGSGLKRGVGRAGARRAYWGSPRGRTISVKPNFCWRGFSGTRLFVSVAHMTSAEVGAFGFLVLESMVTS